MAISIRPAVSEDATELGRILHDAFEALAVQHNFPKDVPSREAGTKSMSRLIATAGYFSAVALGAGKPVGSNFVDFRSSIAAIGPISVDPAVQNTGIGRNLMDAAMVEIGKRNLAGIRIIQAAYHNRSLCLYTALGFATREPLSVLQGKALNINFAGYEVRQATQADLPACNALCRRVHGFDRTRELDTAIEQKTAKVVEHLGRITGYTTDIGFGGHSVAETNTDLQALIGAAAAFPGPGFLLPTRNYEIFRWCLSNGLRLVMQMTLMSAGLYNEPQGAYLPSVSY